MKKQADGQLTLFPEDSLASPFLLPGSKEAQMMTVTSGLKCSELLKNSNPVGLLGKMLLESSNWRSTLCYLTWKVKATPAKRLLFRLAVSMPSTEETESQFWRTPGATDADGRGTYATYEAYKAGKIDKGKQISLTNQVKFPEMWPTPTARDYKDGSAKSCENVPVNGLLGRAVHMWATPNARDGKGPTGFKNQPSLPNQVAMYATPSAADSVGSHGGGQGKSLRTDAGGQLNPDWVEWLMGVPVGWTDIDKDVPFPKPSDGEFWPDEPEGVPRVAKGIPNRVDRLKGLGNMVVPQQFYPIFKAIAEIEVGRVDTA